MITNPNQESMRQVFFDAYQKWQSKQVLTQLESMLASVFEKHPEYHFIFKDPEKYKAQQFFPELGDVNPFMHMSLHIALYEQLMTDRPQGIKKIYQMLLQKYQGDQHMVEHLMMEQIAGLLFTAQRENKMPSDQEYLQVLQSCFELEISF